MTLFGDGSSVKHFGLSKDSRGGGVVKWSTSARAGEDVTATTTLARFGVRRLG